MNSQNIFWKNGVIFHPPTTKLKLQILVEKKCVKIRPRVISVNRVIFLKIHFYTFFSTLKVGTFLSTQVGFAEFSNTADNRANIGGTIIGAPIVGQ